MDYFQLKKSFIAWLGMEKETSQLEIVFFLTKAIIKLIGLDFPIFPSSSGSLGA
jgi:hypothetical protein